MQGKRIFTEDEVARIRAILEEKRWAPRDKQKGLRAKLRRIGFYISDFSSNPDGFGPLDFDELKRTGRIKIREQI